MQGLHAIRIASGIAAIGRELRRHIDQRHTAGLKIFSIFNTEADERLVDVGLVRSGRHIGVIKIIPDNRNRPGRITPGFSLDCRKNSFHSAWQYRKGVENSRHCRVECDRGFEITAKTGFIDTGDITGFRNRTCDCRCCFNNRGIVRPRHCDRDGNRVRRTMFVGHRRRKDIGRGRALGQRLRRRKLVVELIGPRARCGIQFEPTKRSRVGVNRPGQNGASVDI